MIFLLAPMILAGLAALSVETQKYLSGTFRLHLHWLTPIVVNILIGSFSSGCTGLFQSAHASKRQAKDNIVRVVMP